MCFSFMNLKQTNKLEHVKEIIRIAAWLFDRQEKTELSSVRHKLNWLLRALVHEKLP